MVHQEHTISVCLVVYKEPESLMRRALESVKPIAHDIVVVHDGPCTDSTLRIAKEYGATVEELPHIGIAEPHRSRTFELAKGEWILQIDADEYIDEEQGVYDKLRDLVSDDAVDGYIFRWELWDGQKPFHSAGVQKLCLVRRDALRYWGVPQEGLRVRGHTMKAPLFLRHRPLYSNVSWETANKKREYWLRSHVPYFFPEEVRYYPFQDTTEAWVAHTNKVRAHPFVFLLFSPLKNFLGQLKNGLWTSWTGWNIALQQYVYYTVLYYRVWQKHKHISRS